MGALFRRENQNQVHRRDGREGKEQNPVQPTQAPQNEHGAGEQHRGHIGEGEPQGEGARLRAPPAGGAPKERQVHKGQHHGEDAAEDSPRTQNEEPARHNPDGQTPHQTEQADGQREYTAG